MRLAKKLVDYLRRPFRRSKRLEQQATISSHHVPTLPPEVWMIIAGFVDTTELDKLIGVNRVFFEIVMDERYREFGLVDWDPCILFKKINLLKNGKVAYRVRVLKIWPCAVWDAIQVGIPTWRQHQPLASSSETPQGRSLQLNEAITGPPIPGVPMSVEGRCAFVLATIKKLSNVRQLHLRWQKKTALSIETPCPIWPLLARAWPDICPRLSSMFVDMPLAALTEFVASLAPTNAFAHLRQMEIVSSMDRHTVYEGSDFHHDFDALLPLVHKHSGTLDSLSITTYRHIDLSSFLRKLGRLPCLTTLSFTIPFDVNHVLDPQAFNQVLMNHPDLSDLTIRNQFSYCCGSWLRPSNVITEEWLHGCFDGVSFSRLKVLKLGLNYRAVLGQRMIVTMRPLCSSLSSLVLLDRCLEWDDLNIILKSLHPRHLKALSLFVQNLNKEVIYLLLEHCPSLQYLSLNIETVGAWSNVAWNRIGDRQAYNREEERFIEVMQYGRRLELLKAWKLRRIDIWRCEYEEGTRRQWNLMRALADIIPTVTVESLPEGGMPDDHSLYLTMLS